MFGEEILFSPITTQGQTKRSVYLPKGRWVDVNTKEIHEGKRWIECEASIEQFIAFVKENSSVSSVFDCLN